MKKTENFVYIFSGVPYINLTNRCCCDCAFCLRNSGDGVGRDSLWLSCEPDAREVIARLGEVLPQLPRRPREVVFCGYGEPTYRIEELVQIAAYVHSAGIRTRLNTNGLGNLINDRDIVPALAGAIDTVSVSLNAPTSEVYQKICRSVYGEESFYALLRFSEECIRAGIETVLTVVDSLPFAEIEACRKIAAGIGANFRVRKMIEQK